MSLIFLSVNVKCDVVRALADSVATALRSGSHTLEGGTLVNKNLGDVQFTVLCLTP